MMTKEHDELSKKRKEFGKIFFYSVLGVFAFYLILDIFIKDAVTVSTNILLFGFFLTAYTAYLLSKTKFDFIKLMRIIIYFLAFFVYYVALLISDISRAIFFLFVPVILLILLTTSFWKSVFWGAVIVILSMFTTDISAYFNLAIDIDKKYFTSHPESLLIQEYLVIIIATYFSFLIIYYNNEFLKIGSRNMQFAATLETADPEVSSPNDDYHSDDNAIDKDQMLYRKIIKCFEEEKPYKDSHFNIRKLADLVDSNSTYVSKALNQIGNKKFNQLVNEYRINEVKKEILNNIHQKYTLEHIYTNAGFSQQSTFNRIFKEQTGVTPSEYIENLEDTAENI